MGNGFFWDWRVSRANILRTLQVSKPDFRECVSQLESFLVVVLAKVRSPLSANCRKSSVQLCFSPCSVVLLRLLSQPLAFEISAGATLAPSIRNIVRLLILQTHKNGDREKRPSLSHVGSKKIGKMPHHSNIFQS